MRAGLAALVFMRSGGSQIRGRPEPRHVDRREAWRALRHVRFLRLQERLGVRERCAEAGTMPQPLFNTVHHVALICSDYARSKAFYTETLGFRILRETYRVERQSYKLDLEVAAGLTLELFSFPEPPARPSRPEACGLRHLAFATPAFDETLSELRRRGVALEPVRLDEATALRFTFFADPDALPIELYEAPPAGADGGGFATPAEPQRVKDRRK